MILELDPGIISSIRECGPVTGVLAPGGYRLHMEGYAEGLGDISSTAVSHFRLSTAWVPDGGPDLLLLALVLAAVLMAEWADASGKRARGG